MNGQRLEGVASLAQFFMNHMHPHQNSMSTVCNNCQKLEGTAPHAWPMNQVPQGTPSEIQSPSSMNSQRLEGLASHAQSSMNHMHHISKASPVSTDGKRLEGTNPSFSSLF